MMAATMIENKSGDCPYCGRWGLLVLINERAVRMAGHPKKFMCIDKVGCRERQAERTKAIVERLKGSK